ncbi:DUF302 domain-containing protein [Alteromonas sp. C1M14]|uniref:DUF302 domain-containing protein n=1 Tax=Alteromonas sp. C1M14 TaxID=2841567 RepID=UPI001C082398|nr:DUF302 domain-containing protein [Alteromonas sp. C1M14]MBU2978737.1 DUF302 domain-containing protein [Alteromonas sp. C1M14]
MKNSNLLGIILLCTSFWVSASEGLIKQESSYSVAETADRFEAIAKDKGLTLFARINHQQNAGTVNLSLRPTEVLIFGNPKVGTPLMQCAQDVAIDLPQKVLISEDENHQVWVSYNNPEYLMKRHNIKNCDATIKKISAVLSQLSTAAAGQ